MISIYTYDVGHFTKLNIANTELLWRTLEFKRGHGPYFHHLAMHKTLIQMLKKHEVIIVEVKAMKESVVSATMNGSKDQSDSVGG